MVKGQRRLLVESLLLIAPKGAYDTRSVDCSGVHVCSLHSQTRSLSSSVLSVGRRRRCTTSLIAVLLRDSGWYPFAARAVGGMVGPCGLCCGAVHHGIAVCRLQVVDNEGCSFLWLIDWLLVAVEGVVDYGLVVVSLLHAAGVPMVMVFLAIPALG